jgi:hypothetical protein
MKSAFWPVLLLWGTVLAQGTPAGEPPSLFHTLESTDNPAPAARPPEEFLPQMGPTETVAVEGHTDTVAEEERAETALLTPGSQAHPRPREKTFSELPGRVTPNRPAEERVSWTVPAPEEKMRRVNSRHLVFNYKLRKVGSSGVIGAELWYTRDGQNWAKAPSGIQPQGRYQVEVSEDGHYGFTLLARTGFGGGKPPPKKGDRAQVWVEVDTSKPVVVITSIKRRSDSRTVLINWKATDKNLAEQPISISYLDLNTGQTVSIARHMDNSQTYTWQVPLGTPSNIRIRVEATDRFGNVGADETANALHLDLAQPEVTDISVNGPE